MSFRSFLLLTLAACQGGSASSRKEAPAAPSRPAIELRDATGKVTARVSEGRPCRATIDGSDLIIGGRPLVMMLGATRWAGDDIDGSTVLTRDGESVGRIFPADIGTSEVALFDANGVALIRVTAEGDGAIVRDRAQSPVREVRRTPAAIEIITSGGTLVVTGTTDVLLAAVLSAPEASTEVRALAACHRLLPQQKAAS